MMDSLFVLGQESRLRILQQAAERVPGCAYICVWAPINPGAQQQLLPPPPLSSTRSRGHLLCLDAWLRGDVDDRGRALFQAYRGSLCGAVSGCVPGWAFQEGQSYMELPEHDLAASASMPVQLQFYQEAGIEMAAFMACESGEIEMGVSSTAAAPTNNLRASVEQVFSEDFFQQSLLEELLQLPPTRPSSSSSLPSVSVGSPAADGASTSFPRATTTTMAMASSATPSPRDLSLAQPLLHPLFTRHAAHGHGQQHFPSAEADDAAMAQAMLAVISSSSPSSSSMPTASAPTFGNHRGSRRGSATAFRAYNAALAPRRAPGAAAGQRMTKRCISILRRMHVRKCSYSQNQDQQRTAVLQRRREEEEEEVEEAAAPAAPSSSQLHHMISERRRRERLNESFEALRGLLPPGSKKDKATVLANTLEYMNILIAQISEFESKNRALEAAAQVNPPIVNGSSSRERRPDQALVQQGLLRGGSSERVLVEVATNSAGASTSSTPVSREVTIRVAAPGRDLSDLVTRVLRLLKETGHRFTVVAVDASRHPAADGGGIAQASMTLRVTAAGELDEASLREAVAKAVEALVTPLRPSDDDESP